MIRFEASILPSAEYAITIRPAVNHETAECRALLPETFPTVGRIPDLLVAEAGGAILGACALAWVPGGLPIEVAVRAEMRRRGIGRKLVEAAIARARGETPALRSWTSHGEASDAVRFLSSCGFIAQVRMQVYEMEPTRLRETMTGLLVRARARVPTSARLVPLRDAPRGPLVDLVAANLVTPRPYLEEALFGESGIGWDQTLSAVLVVDGTLAGVVLAHRAGVMMEVDLNVVEPRFRGGWANLLQVEAVLRRGHAAGLTQLRFIAAPSVHNTIRLAGRGGATRLPDQIMLAFVFG